MFLFLLSLNFSEVGRDGIRVNCVWQVLIISLLLQVVQLYAYDTHNKNPCISNTMQFALIFCCRQYCNILTNGFFFIYLCIHSSIHSFVRLFIHSFIHSVYSFIHSFIHPPFFLFLSFLPFLTSFISSFLSLFFKIGN